MSTTEHKFVSILFTAFVHLGGGPLACIRGLHSRILFVHSSSFPLITRPAQFYYNNVDILSIIFTTRDLLCMTELGILSRIVTPNIRGFIAFSATCNLCTVVLASVSGSTSKVGCIGKKLFSQDPLEWII